MILVLKIIASCYEKFTPDCFVILNVWYNIACDLRDSKLEIPEDGNDVLNAEHLGTKSALL